MNKIISILPLYKVKDLFFDDEICVIFLLVEEIVYKERNCSNYNTKMILNENKVKVRIFDLLHSVPFLEVGD
jgi:hypothetical protein